MRVKGGTIEEGGGMLVMTLFVVSPTLSSGSAIEEKGANAARSRAEVVDA